MKQLSDILKNVAVDQLIGNTNITITGLTFDSRTVICGNAFIAVSGTQSDGHKFIETAITKGAVAIICEILPKEINSTITYIKVQNSSEALGIIASNYYNNPSSKLDLIGVTGTNGKTTIATLSYHLAKKLGYKTGLLSTVRNYVDEREIHATHTTPDAIAINKLLAEMIAAGCTFCFMEVSSHAIVQNRISGLEFKGGIFTNITHDHLDYHKTFEEYLKAKKMFFDKLPAKAFALVNIDDKNGKVMLQNTEATKNSYSLKSYSDFKCKVLESHFDGMLLNVDGEEVWTKLIGGFNAYNLLSVYGTAILLGHKKEEVLKTLSELNTVEGRFEYIKSSNGVTAIVDYAHTPDALMNVLNTINSIRQGAGKLISVIGAGGNRDKTKRPIMGKITAELSDKVILTSDNPRNEIPEDIIKEIYAGIDAFNKKKVVKIVNREEGIRTAIMLASKEDIILIAGKGHENYQEINGVRHHFDDKEIVAKLFKEIN